MTGKKQQGEQEELRAATAVLIRAIILAAIVALVVSAAPFASAGTSKAKPPRFERAEQATAFVWEAELSPVVTGSPRGKIEGGPTTSHSMIVRRSGYCRAANRTEGDFSPA